MSLESARRAEAPSEKAAHLFALYDSPPSMGRERFSKLRLGVRAACLMVALLISSACGARDVELETPRSLNGPQAGAPGQTETSEVRYERMADGSVRKTTVTRRTVPVQAPNARPADPFPTDPLVRYNVERVNGYRARAGLPPLLYDARLSAFAIRGSQRLASDHVPHANFAEHAQAARFGSRSAENQGDPSGVPQLDPRPWQNAQKQVDTMLKLMMDEGPGGGHYDNIMSPNMRRIGIGNIYVGGRFYMTNDFSD